MVELDKSKHVNSYDFINLYFLIKYHGSLSFFL